MVYLSGCFWVKEETVNNCDKETGAKGTVPGKLEYVATPIIDKMFWESNPSSFNDLTREWRTCFPGEHSLSGWTQGLDVLSCLCLLLPPVLKKARTLSYGGYVNIIWQIMLRGTFFSYLCADEGFLDILSLPATLAVGKKMTLLCKAKRFSEIRRFFPCTVGGGGVPPHPHPDPNWFHSVFPNRGKQNVYQW